MDHGFSEHLQLEPPYAEVQTNCGKDANGHPGPEDFGGYFVRGTVSSASAASGTIQSMVLYLVPKDGSNPDFELQMSRSGKHVFNLEEIEGNFSPQFQFPRPATASASEGGVRP